jgi:hypothetical protein
MAASRRPACSPRRYRESRAAPRGRYSATAGRAYRSVPAARSWRADPADLVLAPAQLPGGGDATSDAGAVWAIVRTALASHHVALPDDAAGD